MPLCHLTVRGPMGPDGAAGPELPPGQVGAVCFSGPQLFLGYLNDPAATAAAACVGAEHAVWAEAIVLLVETAPGRTLTAAQVMAACTGMASYARPSHVAILAPARCR